LASLIWTGTYLIVPLWLFTVFTEKNAARIGSAVNVCWTIYKGNWPKLVWL